MDKLEIQRLLANSTPIKCPNSECNSEYFMETVKMKKVSALISPTGKTEFLPVRGPMICVECHRPLTDADFGFTNEPENNDDSQSTG